MDCFAPLGARNDECQITAQPCGRQRSFPRTGRRSSNPCRQPVCRQAEESQSLTRKSETLLGFR
jgi:hypothetical protein